MSVIEAKCENPDCDATTIVTIWAATLTDPSCPATDACEECGAYLDFEDAEPIGPEDIEYMKYANDPRV